MAVEQFSQDEGSHESELATPWAILPMRSQVAALPIKEEAGWRPRVLLLTSRETGRWIIPKGWPMPQFSDARAAAEEAREEGGITGRIRGDKPAGHFSYRKTLRDGEAVICRVAVYLLHVERELKKWKEQEMRRRLWVDPEVAATMVAEPELAELLRRVGRGELR